MVSQRPLSAVSSDTPSPGVNVVNGKRGQKKPNYTQKALDNEAVGKAGEAIALKYERWRLKEFPELAGRIVHVAETDDSAGYDILSFWPDGSERFVEVKATTGLPDSRFFLTAAEIACSEQCKEQYVLLRISGILDNIEICEVQAPLEQNLVISPAIFSVRFN